MITKIKPANFDFTKWGPIIEARIPMDYTHTSVGCAASDCTVEAKEDMYAIVVVAKQIDTYWCNHEWPLTLIDDAIPGDYEFYVLCQNIDGTKRLIWHSPGA